MAANIIHEFYVPMPEAQSRSALVSIEPASGIVGTTMESVISIVVTGTGTVVHYDEWEDGYEVDINNPAQSTTKIWGDGNNANGIPPGYANDPASFPSGAVINLRNQITLPRNPATVLYDGRDRFGGTKALVVTRTGWAVAPGTVLAGSVEVTATMDYGTSYVSPVGQDVSANQMFEYVGLMVMARENGTSVTVDVNGPVAGGATTFTLNQGESYLVNGGVLKGATVTSTKPVEVQLITGDIGARYETDWFTLYPVDQWTGTYYSPVGTATDGDATLGFFYNPTGSALTINVVTGIGTGSFSVPANGVYQYQMPQGGGAKFTSAGEVPFFGIVMVGANPTANNVHDWGFTLVPSDSLTTEAVVGWGPGSSDLSQNGSPVWVTPIAASRIYVDYNGDRNGPLTDPKGNKYDVHYDVSALATKLLFDPDKDQSAMRVYTLDGVQIAAAWGQDPATAGPGNPFLDVGTTVLPFPVPTLIKSFSIVTDTAPSGLSIGDTIEYRIDVDNKGLLPLGNLLVLDPLNPSLTYVAGTTTRDGSAIPDDGTGSTIFPLDESGYVIPIILRGGNTTFTYRCVINAAGSINNTASNSNYNLVSSANVVVPPPAGSTPCGAQFTNAAGVVQSTYSAGALIYATLTDPDANNDIAAIENITIVANNTSNGDAEFVTLVETGVNTGVFRNTTGLPTSTTAGTSQMDGTLLVSPGNSLSFTYTDPEFNETCSGAASISVPTQNKYLYLSDPSQALDRVDPVATADGTTASTGALNYTPPGVVTGTTTSSSVVNASSLTFSHTPGSGANKLLVVAVSMGSSAVGGAAGTVSGVTYNGTAMTQIGTQVAAGGTPGARIYLFRLLNPVAGPANVVVSASAASTIEAGATTFENVDQVTPLGTFASTNGASGTPTLNVTSATNETVICVGAIDEAATQQGITTPGGQSQLWASGGTDFVSGATSTKPGAASVTFTYTPGDNTQEWAIGGISIKPASGGGATTTSFTQAPAFAASFSMPVGATPTVTAHYTVSSGTMPGSPAITATLKNGAATIATSTGTTASAATGSGVFTFTFASFGVAANFVASDALILQLDDTQTGVTFTVDFDSSAKPSKITLPTTTVIGVDSLDVYDAPYPGGSLITAPASGTTVYVRSTASDPFGAYDITSMGLSIDGPGASGDVTTTLNAGNVVNTTAATKTYEYAWTVGSTIGTYNIAVTANEGTEGINATRATSVNVTFLDLGTPSVTEFTSSLNGPGTDTYAGNGTIFVRITDLDQNLDAGAIETIQATITSAIGDSELVTLTETGPNTGIFVVSIPGSTSAPNTPDNGTLHAVLGDVLTVNYIDPTDPTDTGSDTATIPNSAPAISVNKTLVLPADGTAIIGEQVQYQMQVTNTGNTTLATIALRDTFPAAKLSYVSASTAPDTVASGQLDWTNVGPLNPGQSRTITLNFTALATAAPATNTAIANPSGSPTSSDTADVTITDPRVVVTKTLLSPNPGPANINDNVTFRIAMQNTGTTVIASLPLEDTFSGADFEFVSATVAPDATGNGSLLWLDVTGAGTLAVSATTTIDITLKAKGAATPATNLAKAEYTVDVNGDPAPPSSSSATITLIAAKITGHVYDDKDQSVTFNGGDGVLENVTVSLYTDPNADGNPADGTLVAMTTTDVTGYYEFLNLEVGSYVVVESQLPGYSSSGDTQGANDNRISVNASTLTTFANNNFFDFLTPPASYATISGKVWNDANASATVNGGEVGIANVSVDLVEDTNGNGVADAGEPVISSTLTASDGTYSFIGVAPGNYVVVEHDLFGWYSTADSALPNNNMIPVVATAGGTFANRDFLDVLTGTVGGKVFHDVNGNGVYNAGVDAVLANIDVIVTNSQGVAQTVVTDVNGDWTATVPPGSTTVDVQQSDPQFTAVFTIGYQQTAGTDPNTVAAVSSVNTPAGDDGFLLVGRVSGHLYLDENGNGTQDGTEPDLADVDVVITKSDTTTVTVTTDANGDWTVLVPAGGTSSDVDETDPEFAALVLSGYTQTQGTEPTSVTAVVNTTVNGGTDGYFNPGSLSGTVLADTDNDDIGDAGINGVVLTLLDGSGNIIDGDTGTPGVQPITATTNGSGVYIFNNLVPGTYRVSEAQPGGYASLEDRDGGNLDVIGDVVARVIDPGEHETGNNFVEEQYGSIGGTVLADTDNDDIGDAGISGVVLTLLDLTGAIIDGDSGTPGVQAITATTDGGGAYTFSNVPPGDYRIGEAQPGGYQSVSDSDGGNLDQIGDVTLVTVTAGVSNADKDFVEEQLGEITGTVFADTDNNDTGDTAMQSVVLALFSDPNGDGNPADGAQLGGTVQTNAGGIYTFTGIAPGSYVVVQTQPSGYLTVTDGDTTTPGDDAANSSTTDDRIPVALVAGETDDGNAFIEEQAATISGSVLADTNNDNTGDAPVSGVTVALFTDPNNDGNPADGAQVGSTQLTIADGSYSFTNVAPGSYVVVETQPAGYLTVSDADAIADAGGSPADAANASATDNRIPMNVQAGEAEQGNNFIEEQPGTITGHLYVDTNGDGNQDPGEPDLANVDVIITKSDLTTMTVTTNSTGDWTASVPPGDTIADIDNTDPQFTAAVLAGFVQTEGTDPNTVTVSAGASIGSGIDGFFNPATISGSVSRDTNNDNIGDAPASGVTVALFSDPNADGDPADGSQVGLSQLTSGAGAYSFTGLYPGAYVVVMTTPSGYVAIVDGDTTTPADDAANASQTDARVPAGVTGGEIDNGNNFVIEQGGTITGTVLADINDDDTGDDPIANVTLTLVDSSGNPVDGDTGTPGVQPITTTTDVNGDYTFSGVPPGTYGVKETQPAGFLEVTDSDGGNPSEVRPITVTAGGTSTASFVEEAAASLTGSVLADTDNDDIGDAGISGVVLTLLDGSGAVIDGDSGTPGVQPITATTNASGAYAFNNLRPGTYQISEAQPSGYASLEDRDSGDLDVIGDVVPRVLDAGEVDANNNFVEEQYGSISGSVLADTNNDDAGDTGMSGVVLTLLDLSGAIIDGDPNTGGVQPITATTNGSGAFSFSNVAPGSYRIGEAQPGGYQSVSDSDGGSLDQIGDVTLVDVTAGAATTGLEFVEEQLGSISGTVSATGPLSGASVALFSDPNGDGDPSDGGQIGGSVLTNGSGAYLFTGVAPGDYVVVETQPSGWVSVNDGDTTTPNDDAVNASGTDNRVPVSITAGENDDGNNFLEGCPTITVNPASLAAATVGTPYIDTLSASGGTAAYSFAITAGALPAGLNLVGADIVGTPTSSTAANFTITATDANGCTGARSYTFTPTCPTITVTPASLPGATVGTPYSVTLGASGGTSGYTFAVTNGTLPAGLTLVSGVIGGTPTSTTSQTFTITATDTYNCTGAVTFTLTPVCPTITVNPISLPDAAVGSTYNQTLSASGGTAGYTFAITTGVLPTGLNLVGDTITGTSTAAESQTFTITATDANGCTGTRSLTINAVCPTVTVSPVSLPAATVGTPYTATLSASGGTAAYTFAVTVGNLPAGLTLVGDTISGTPTSETAETFTITATDAHNCTGTRSFTLAPVCPTISLSSVPLPLAAGTVGSPYGGTINASGGTPAYTFAVKVGSSLPPGIVLASNGTLSGTPTTNVTTNTIIVATDANGCKGESTFVFNIGCNTLGVAPGTLANGVVGTAYTPVTFTSTGGTGTVTWQLTGALPAGMSFTPATATLGGTPTEVGSYSVTVIATDSNTCSGSVNLSFSTSCPTVTVNPISLSAATVGTSYSATLSASGGTAAYTFAVTTGSLPAGLNLVGDTITGTPTSTVSETFTITATDTYGCTGTRSFTLAPTCPTIAVNPASLPNGVVGSSYNQTLTGSGGTANYSFAVTAGNLPVGLNLASGVISGTPTSTAGASFTITATDAYGCTGSRSFTVTPVCPTISISPIALASATVGTPYNQTLTASGGTANYTFAVTTGVLPTGLNLVAGVITGTPTDTTSETFTITTTDAYGCTGTRGFTLTPTCPTMTINPTSLPGAVVGTSYTATLTTTGGTAPFTYALGGGTLPAGLSIVNDTITGTPTATTSQTFTITVTDDYGCTGSRSFTLAPTCPTISVSSTPAVLPSGTIQSPYTATMSANGGSGPYAFAVTGGLLPAGLTLSPAGGISGTPTGPEGGSSFQITATDIYGCTGFSVFTISIDCNPLVVTPASISNPFVGQNYALPFSAAGALAPITWSYYGGLPPGMSFNTATGTLEGIPEQVGIYSIGVVATDANGCSGSIYTSYSTLCPTITVSPATIPNPTIDVPYSTSFSATGGASPYTFVISAYGPPAGLTLTGDTLSGTVPISSPQIFEITAIDKFGCRGSRTYTLVPQCPTVTVAPTSLPDGVVGTFYSQTISATGGNGSYFYSVTSGALPAGLLLSSGTLSGTPTSTAPATFVVRATDTNGCYGEQSFTVTPACPSITVNPASLAAAVVGSSYNELLSATGGTAPYSFAVTIGSLPAGLNIVGSTVTGVPTSATSETFTITATDSTGCTGARSFTLAPTCPTITVGPASLPIADAGVSYSQTLSATGGTAPYTFAVTTGSLPAGLTLGGSTISGTPTAGGLVSFTITATDANGCEGTRNLSIDVRSASISGSVLADTNNDDTGDIGMSGILVTLLDASGNPVDGDSGTPGVQPVTALTNGSGVFTFSNVPPGTYRVGEGQPSGYQSVSDSDGGDLNQIGDITPVIVAAGAAVNGLLFVEEQFGSVSGTVLVDTNDDDTGDGPAVGVTVKLFSDPNGDGNPADGSQVGPTKLTNATGAFNFNNLNPASYVVVIIPLSGYASVGDGDTTTPADDAANSSQSDSRVPVAIAAGEADTGNDFLIEQGATISGTVLADTNNDNTGDTPISGVVLTLLDAGGNVIDGDSGTAGVQPITATTNGGGIYTFAGIAPGNYRVSEAQPPLYSSVSDTDGGDLDVIGDQTPIAVAAGVVSSGNDFVEEQTGTIGNLVWVDANNNGIKDPAESGLDGVVVELLDASSNPIDSDPNTAGVQPTTTTTSGGGFYSFSGIPTGNYRLRIGSPPAQYPISSSVTNTNDDGTNDDDNGIQSVAGGAIMSPVITLAPSENEQTLDFGLVSGGVIGNSVWQDQNANGQKEGGEPGLSGIAVSLLDSLGNAVDDPNQAGVQPYVVTTNGSGDYSFTNLVPGTYQVKITTPPASYPLSSAATSTDDDQIDDDDNGTQSMPTAPVTSPLIAIAHGETDNTIDFGFTAINGFYSIGGQVRDDFDSDGNFSDNDTPVPSVTVKLYADSNGNGSYDPGIDTLVTTATTNGLGQYLFTALPDGTYFIEEVDPRPASSTADREGSLTDNLIKVVIAGASSTGNDFLDAVDPMGYFYDTETGEIIPGGSISVVGPGTATLLMDGSSGQFSFITDGTPGIYVMSITPPPGYTRDPSRPEIPGSFDPTGLPDPYAMGSAEDPLNPGNLVNFTAAANPYYVCFTLEPGDPLVINNNIPLLRDKPITFTGWQARNPLGGSNGPTQNPDGDRFDNLQEYAFCYSPDTGVSIGCPLKIVVNANGRVDAQVRRATNLTDVIYTLEYIADLSTSTANGGGWTNVTTIVPTVVTNVDGTEIATYQDLATLPGLIAGKGFVRIKVELDSNGDTVPEQTSRTLASGWDTRELSVQCQTCSMPFFVCDIFSGAVDSLAGSTLNVTTSAGTGSISAAFVSGRQYYIEVLSGDNAGHRFDVDEAASTAGSIVISTAAGNRNTLASVPANLAGDVIAVRQHYTMDDLFTKSLFNATNNQATADRLLFFNPNTGAFDEIYWLFLNGGVPKWVQTTDAFLNDKGGRVIDPAQALYVHCRTHPVNLIYSGHVRQNSFACPLNAGVNLIGSGYPMDQSPVMREMTVANGFTGGRDARLSDQVRFWAGDSSPGTEAYVSHFLVETAGLHQWSPQSNASLLNENNVLLFESLHGCFVKSVTGKSDWVLPTPWTP